MHDRLRAGSLKLCEPQSRKMPKNATLGRAQPL
jgi:hypothetical protein